MQGGAPGTSSVVIFLAKSLPFLSMPLVMFPTQLASTIKMKPQSVKEGERSWKENSEITRIHSSETSSCERLFLVGESVGSTGCFINHCLLPASWACLCLCCQTLAS